MNYGFRINLTVSQVQYPSTTEETAHFKLSTYETWNKTLLSIDESVPNITFRVTTPNPFTFIAANRTSLDPNTRTNIILDLILGVGTSKDAFLLLQIPESQLVLDYSISSLPICFRGTNITGA